MKRELSKTPPIPNLSADVCALLTQLCFKETLPIKETDLLFCYGTPFCIPQMAHHLTQLLMNKVSNHVLIAGGFTAEGLPLIENKSESRLIYEHIPPIFAHVNFFLEEKSHHTLENVVNGLNIINFQNYRRIGFVSPSHMAQRCYLMLRKFCPKSRVDPLCYDAFYPGEPKPVSKTNWTTFALGKKRVWGEFLRIQCYGMRGDIAFDEVRNFVLNIKEACPY